MKRFFAITALALSSSAAAAPPPAPAPAATAPAVAEALAPVVETAPIDPFAEPRNLVEFQANNIANLKKAIELYEAALKDESSAKRVRAEACSDVARAYLRWGDLLKNDEEKIALYEKGMAAGKRGEAIDPQSEAAAFWGTANQACVGRTRGPMNSLFMVGDLKKGMNRALSINPNYHWARNTLGEIDHSVPGFVGGSDDRAEKAYLETLRRDSHFTAAMVLLAKLKRDNGDKEAAIAWAQKVINEKAPTHRNDWKKFDLNDARAVLQELQ